MKRKTIKISQKKTEEAALVYKLNIEQRMDFTHFSIILND
jgi:hypothetical protein